MNPKVKKILIIVAVIIVIAVVAVFLINSSSSTPTQSRGLVSGTTGAPVANPTKSSDGAIGRDFVSMLLNLKEIKLDNSLFNDPAFLSLNDFTITLVQPGGEGRTNPFAPFTTTMDPSLNIAGNTTSTQNEDVFGFPQ